MGVTALWLVHGWAGAPVITNDGYQYLDTASSIVSEGCFCSHMAHFDEQLPIGHLPVAMTHYSPGYPLLIAGVSRFGLTGESAGYLISVIGFLVTIWLIWHVGRTLGAPPLLAFVFVLPWIAHGRNRIGLCSSGCRRIRTLRRYSSGWWRSSSGISKQTARTRRSSRVSAVWRAPPISCAMPDCPRYLLHSSTCSGALPANARSPTPGRLPDLAQRRPSWRRFQIRNIIYSGSWRGLPAADSPRGLLSAVITHVVSLYHLVLGDFHPVPLSIWIGLCVLSLPTGALFLALQAWRRGAWGRKFEFAPVALTWIGLIGIVYTLPARCRDHWQRQHGPGSNKSACVITFRSIRSCCPASLAYGFPDSTSSVAFDGGRPGADCRGASQREFHRAAGSAGTRTSDGRESPERGSPRANPFDAGFSTMFPEKQPVVAQEGQVLGYLLHRATVTPMEPPESSNLPYDGPTFFSLMSRYKSRYLLLFPAMRPPQVSLFPF